MKYTYLLFDVDGTLFDYERAETFALESSFKSFGIQFSGELHHSAYRRINRTIWEELERGEITPKILRVERFIRFFNELGLNLPVQEFSRCYLDFLAAASFLIDGAEEVVKHFLNRGCTIALITNGLTSVQYPRINKSTIGPYFKYIFVSEEIGVAKPNRGIFEYAFDTAGLNLADRERTLMIGDSLSSDIKGGIDFGIDTCWYNPTGNEAPDGLHPTYNIKALSELLQIPL
ncbi:MAG: YjjG family noncanonical pyrimidine nucleotidase [Spirochaetota bacterium]